MPGHRTMGSTPSSPNRDISEKFWVPPAVLERKRAQSLVPTLSHRESDDDPFSGSGATTPGSAGLREMSFNFSTEKMDGLPTFSMKNRQRRASMQDAIDLRKIDTKLYDRRLQRHRSFCSSTEEDNSLGSVNLRLQYNPETHLLSVEIVQVADLVPQDSTNSANPYCKVTLLPDHPSQLRTRVQDHTLDPFFEEEFIFDVSSQKLKSSVLEVLVMDNDQCGQDICLGQMKLPMDSVDFNDSSQIEMWRGLTHFEEQKQDEKTNGEIMFSLSYLSSAERLTIVVIEARNLRHPESNKVIDPSVKVSVLQNAKRLKKKKTSTAHGTDCPTYNEALVFNIPREMLHNISLDIQVCHENKIGNDDVVGRVRLGLDTTGEEKVHWNDLMSCKGSLARWHTLTT